MSVERNWCEEISKAIQALNFSVSRSRVLVAHEQSLQLRELLAFASAEDHSISTCPQGSSCPVLPGEARDDLENLFLSLEERSTAIKNVMNECHEFKHSSHDNNREEGNVADESGDFDVDGGWVLGAHMFGIRTYYKTDDDGQISLRMEADQEVPVFEQMAVLNECELYSDWIPFCTSSSLVKKISHAEQIFHTYFTTPFAIRDMLVHVYAADCVMSDSCVAFVGRSVTQEEMALDSDTTWPSEPNYFFGCRADIIQLSGVIRMTSNKSAKSIILMKVNPKIHLPQMLINFLIRKMAGVFLYFLEKKAVSLAEDEHLDTNLYAKRMKENSEFYVEWLLPAVRGFCHARGWDQFTVRLLGEDGIPEEGKEYLIPEAVIS